MNRIFGTSASKKPKPSLQDAITSVGAIRFSVLSPLIKAIMSDRHTYGLD